MNVDQFARAARQVAEQRVRGCRRPIRLKGRTTRGNRETGEVLSSYSSADEFDGITYVRCGDRRAWLCESCSREYKGDAWHLLTAGLTGGKGTPEDVADVPALFLTLTAPSFGVTHGLRQRGTCRPRRDKPTCPHGRAQWCHQHHQEGDPRLGEPLCPQCYDYQAHVAWQWLAPELWRYTRTHLERRLADLLGIPRKEAPRSFKLAYSKVAEFQARGVVHFHVVLRADGPDGPGSQPHAAITPEALAQAVAETVKTTTLTRPITSDTVLRLRWGTQLDIQPITTAADRDSYRGGAHPEKVASYLAKYLTKSTEDFGIRRRVRCVADTRGLRAHVRAIITTAHGVAQAGVIRDADRLKRCYATLGYRGHWLTKTRRYSTTFRALRCARQAWRQKAPGLDPDATVRDLPADDDPASDEAHIIELRDWAYHGTGYLSEHEQAQAVMSAQAARSYA